MLETVNVSTCILSIFARNSSECLSLPFPAIVFSISINLILGFPAHCYIVWLSMKEMIRGQSPEVFIFNSSLVEVIFNFAFPIVIKYYFFHCSNCKTAGMGLGMILLVGRPLFQTCICVERYLGVLHPVTFLKFKPIKYRIIISIVGWSQIICSCLLSTMGAVDVFNLLFTQYLVFFIMEMFACLMVLKALRRPGPSDNVKQRDGVSQDKVKAFRIIQIVLVSSLLTYGPAVITLLFYYVLEYKTFMLCWSCCFCSGIMFGFVQPCLYLKRVSKVCLCFGN